MLETVEATRFIKELGSGRNLPWLLEAERANGDVVEVVAKLGSAECGVGGLVREAYSSMLAADLGLPVSEPFVVNLGSDFVSELTAIQQGRCAGHQTCFGCEYVPHMLQVQPGSTLPGYLLEAAGHTLAFDAGVLNADRLMSKPNCLTDGKSLLLIDHELSLNLHGRGFLFHDPWTDGALNVMTSGPSTHLFYNAVRSSIPMKSQFFDSLGKVAPSRVEEYRSAIPSEWDIDGLSKGISDFLLDLIGNAKGLESQIKAITS
ncbi:TPA: HipA family kinase [Stenotrophomonas maltophilia]